MNLPATAAAAALLLLSASTQASARLRRLPVETAPIDTSGIMSSPLWDFSRASVVDPDSPMLSEIHGDSLLSESWPGRQEWLGWDGRSLSYLGGETLSRIVSARKAPALFAFPLSPGAAPAQPFAGSGRVYSRYPYAELGSVEAEVGVSGTLVTAGGDTLASVTVTRQLKDVAAGMNRTLGDLASLPPDSTARAAAVTYRWYAPGDPLPLALLHMSPSEARAFVLDYGPDDLPPACRERGADADPRAVALALANAAVECGGGSLKVTLELPEGVAATVRVDVLDVAGNSYASRTQPCRGAASVEIPTAGLPRGEYLAAIASPSAPGAAEKRQILIR